MVIKLACTCASLTPAPRFQSSSSLCPSPFNCITRNIKRHLPPSHSTFSHTPSLCFTPFSLLLSIFSLFTLSLSRATLVHSSFLLLPLFLTYSTLLFFPFILPFLTFAFHALVFPSGNAFSSSF